MMDEKYLAVIGRQAMRIVDLERQLEDNQERFRNIHLMLCNVQGPLNGNVKRYSPAQLKLFFDINEEIEGALT